MPTVGQQKFPYTQKGMAEAEQYGRLTGMPVQHEQGQQPGFGKAGPQGGYGGGMGGPPQVGAPNPMAMRGQGIGPGPMGGGGGLQQQMSQLAQNPQIMQGLRQLLANSGMPGGRPGGMQGGRMPGGMPAMTQQMPPGGMPRGMPPAGMPPAGMPGATPPRRLPPRAMGPPPGAVPGGGATTPGGGGGPV